MTRCKTAAVAAALLFASAAGAAAEEPKQKSPEDLAAEGVGKIVAALELILGSIPTYEMPEVLPNGDIIIRRKRPESERDGRGGPDRAPEDGTRDADDDAGKPI